MEKYENGNKVVEVTLSTGSKYKMLDLSLEGGFEWLEIEKNVREDTNKMINEKLKFFIVEPKIEGDASKALRMKEGIELIRHINRLNGMGDFTTGQENSQEQTDGKDTTTS